MFSEAKTTNQSRTRAFRGFPFICFKEESTRVMAVEAIKLKAEEGEEEEEEEELVDPASMIKEKCGEDNCIGAKVR